MTGALHAAAGVNNRLRCRNLAAEVRRIQGATQNRLVHLTQLRQGELLTQERVRNTRVLHLVLQAVERVLNDFVVVEGELGQLIDREPADVLVHASVRDLGGGNRRPVHHGNHALVISTGCRVGLAHNAGGTRLGGAQNVTECVELLQVAGLQVGCALQGRSGSLFEGKIRVKRTARKRPLALIGLAEAANQRQPQGRVGFVFLGAQCQNNGRDGEGYRGVVHVVVLFNGDCAGKRLGCDAHSDLLCEWVSIGVHTLPILRG
ncbi:Uncharacterised protein [Mycobacterium tuberculosis]|nr:Uncharacterised protein [Mycobacterium tuberculosis]